MLRLSRGRFSARAADGRQDVARAQALRYRSFIAGTGAAPRADGRDSDSFDDLCTHILVEDSKSGALVCCFRLMRLRQGAEIGRSYAAQYYELSALSRFSGPMVELGRFCIDPDWNDPDILRIAWGAMTRFVDDQGCELLFGCSSFHGTDAARYTDAFAMLRDRHLAPKRWLPSVKAPDVFRFAQRLRRSPDKARALRSMPPLLRTYLAMGGWVSDHAVVDTDLNTLHVFTGLEIGTVPPARARLLRALAG